MIINSPWVPTSKKVEVITRTPVGLLINFNGSLGYLHKKYEMLNKSNGLSINIEAGVDYATQQDIETRNMIWYVI